MKRMVVATAALVLVSCQTKQISELNYSERKELAAQIVSICESQGVKQNTAEMERCLRAEVSAEDAKRKKAYAWRQGMGDSIIAAGQNTSAAYSNASAATLSRNTSVTCNTFNNGPYSTTRCY